MTVVTGNEELLPSAYKVSATQEEKVLELRSPTPLTVNNNALLA